LWNKIGETFLEDPDMFRRTLLLVVPLVLLVGCSSVSLKVIPGPMNLFTNHRYGYELLIPNDWSISKNSNVRPTELTLKAPKTDAVIIVEVMEGGSAPELEQLIEAHSHQKGTESFTLIRSWHLPFDDNTGYVVQFVWKGTMTFGKPKADKPKYGKPRVEYQASVAIVERNPSPIILTCFAPKEKFSKLNVDYFGHSRDSLKVQSVELTIRKVREE
jgi:hypothetical protein